MRELLNELSLPGDMGFILRTAGLNRTKRELQSDLNYLVRLWKTVEQRISNERAPCRVVPGIGSGDSYHPRRVLERFCTDRGR